MRTKCRICGCEKPVKAFAWRDKARGKRQSACRVCFRGLRRDWYEQNKSKHIAAVKVNKAKVENLYRARLADYMRTHPCVDCGEKDLVVLDFDHVRGKKKFNISTAAHSAYAWDSILDELKKCEVRCANCHRRITAKRGNLKTKACVM